MQFFSIFSKNTTLIIKKWKEIKMQGNQSIKILEMSFSLYSDLGTNAKLCQTKREEYVMLLSWL